MFPDLKKYEGMAGELTQRMKAVGGALYNLLFEHGCYPHGVDGVTPHDPMRLPVDGWAEIAAEGSQTLDSRQMLGGKQCTRGHIVNNGDGDLLIRFHTASGATSQWYLLASNSARDFAGFVHVKLDVLGTDVGSRYSYSLQ